MRFDALEKKMLIIRRPIEGGRDPTGGGQEEPWLE